MMRVPAPADALRVARALLDVSQRVAAQRANVTQKSVSAAENSKSVLFETNLALVTYYQREGIEFLGEGSIGEPVRRSGAKWISPDGPSGMEPIVKKFHCEPTDVSFRAARALLGKEQSEVAELAKLGVDAVKGLERGDSARRSYEVLREWYEEQKVEFTGWGDIATRQFYGVGVRWKD
jgi:transcriptional regulator with XRE-family HTH domain